MVLLEKMTMASRAFTVYETEVSEEGQADRVEEVTVEVSPPSEEARLAAAEVSVCSAEKGKRSKGEIVEAKRLIAAVKPLVVPTKGLDQRGVEMSKASSSKGKIRAEEAVALMASIPKGKECISMESTPDMSVGGNDGPPVGENKEVEEGGWQKVQGRSRRSKEVPESSKRGASHFKRAYGDLSLRNVVCFRCLGRGHLARDCRDPPRCWSCKRMGHRSFGCKFENRGNPRQGGQARPPGVPPPGHPPLCRVEVEWSSEILDRARSLCKSVVATWEGGQEVQGAALLAHLQLRWKGIPFGSVWKCGRCKFFVRLPSSVARDLILKERKLAVDGGAISFSEPVLSDLGVRGYQMQVLLRGLPMVWRTEGVLRKVVEPFGFLMNYVEILDSEETFPPAKVTVWVTKETVPPPVLVAVLGGLEVLVQVEVLSFSRTNSYADTVKFGPKAASRWVPVGDGLGKGVSGSTAGISSGSPVVESEQGQGSGSLPASLQTVSRSEGLADVASSGDPPGCQLAINDGGSVPCSDDLSAGQIAGCSLKCKVACPPVSVGGRSASGRGRQGPFHVSMVAGGRGDGQRVERRRDVSEYFKRQVVGIFKQHAGSSGGRKVDGRGSRPIKPISSALHSRDPSCPKDRVPARVHEVRSDVCPSHVHTDSPLFKPVKDPMQKKVKPKHKTKIKSIIVCQPVREVDYGASLLMEAVTVPSEAVTSSPSLAEGISSHGEHIDGGLAVSEEEEVPLTGQVSVLAMVPYSEGVEDLLGSGSQTPKEVPLSIVVEPGEAEFLGSPGCEKAKQIGVIFKNEGERFQFKSFLYKSKQESGANLPCRNQQNLS
ncbi:hypothetical protein QJS04_geneDACA021592 [Acorus gramineus]|uniref:CCHC-type domain-containing protein n=1 Tax=Acorus gramineus TaxID=55184 RepID=A0AAV9B668_ACOGR|nr:hypothetical protein QJS04_geneDACA021592 [Acorus gramineus]